MEGFKNLVPQYALVRRNGGEKITVNTLFNITNCLHTENVRQWKICFETLSSVPYHCAQTIISAFKVSHFQRRLNDILLYQSISHKKLLISSGIYKNFFFSVNEFCIKTFDSQVKAEELTLGDIVEIKFGDR